MKLRDHACHYCPGVAFGQKNSLTTHIDTVHLERRDHACPDCPGVAFGQKCNLAHHSNHVHLKIPRTTTRK